MSDKVIYVKLCFLTFVGSKTNSSKNNPWEGWTILCTTSGIEN
jgi:hypothetical protein